MSFFGGCVREWSEFYSWKLGTVCADISTLPLYAGFGRRGRVTIVIIFNFND